MVPSKLNCKKRFVIHFPPTTARNLVDCSTSARLQYGVHSSSRTQTQSRQPLPEFSLRSPAAAKHAHLPAREPTHPAAVRFVQSQQRLPFFSWRTGIGIEQPNTPLARQTAAGQRRQFPSHPSSLPKTSLVRNKAGCPNPETAYPNPCRGMNRPQRLQIAFPHTLESSSCRLPITDD